MIKTLNYTYENHQKLQLFIHRNQLDTFPALLVQIFSGEQENKLKTIQQQLKLLVPEATIIGCTTAGEIIGSSLQEKSIVISFTGFDKTSIDSCIVEQRDFPDCFMMGKRVSEMLIDPQTKAMIIMIGSVDIDTQQFLDGIFSSKPDILITGGIAGNNGSLEGTYVFNGDTSVSQGAVAIALKSDSLIAEAGADFKWREIGRKLTVTKAEGRVIYTIENKKPIQILKHYLGADFVRSLPRSGAEFPFISEKKGEKFPLYITKLYDSGAVEMNRPLLTGDLLTIAYPDIALVIEESLVNMKRLSKKPIETLFVFHSTARKYFLNDYVKAELRMLQQIAPVAGFCSYGEISSQKKKTAQLTGYSFSYLALSESAELPQKENSLFEYQPPQHLNSIMILTHLMQAAENDTRKLNEHLSVSSQYYRSLFNNNADFVYSTDLKGNFTSVNRSFEKTFGYMENEVVGKSALKFIKKEDAARAAAHFLKALQGKEQFYNLRIPDVNGDVQLFQMKNIPIKVDGAAIGIYGIGRNISDIVKSEEKIAKLAYVDPQTGLPNRQKITEQLGDLIKRASKKKRKLAVLFIDIDRFKIINDSLGHYAGDLILKDLAERVQEEFPAGAYLGRFSGDKFTLILTKNVNSDEVMNTAKKITRCISEPIHFDQKEFFVTASIGASLFPEDGSDEKELLKNADIAINISKKSGGNRITFFSTEMNEQALKRLELESYLRKALQKEEFYLCYQPLIDLASGKVYGSEALLRWNHPKLGLVSPGEFIPLAEETGLIDDIGNWVLRTACIQNKKWQELGIEKLTISINVSAYQFQKDSFLMDVKLALEEAGLEPKYLNLELTESATLQNIDYSILTMKALQDLGVKVSIDDFGTGYSSLSYLRNLPINTLKIDRSFINNLMMDTSDIAIVKAIITMGQGLSVKVVAEGVETKEQIDLLKELDCHFAQGFYLYKPLMASDFEKYFSPKEIHM
ncbi:EAL domain-containing protein [Neobacillus terrae]|uniref:bifunctional diguanylate cyclase/phosphodiesterase n=1 Tax=Neobacillus terrae TaxID=3034837 RepID=UPI00140A467B|nr:EAL domain-containing protein [Neobacillus terrae]NHM31702.1 EAL domain-containing protein [Neobacillus terrae]